MGYLGHFMSSQYSIERFLAPVGSVTGSLDHFVSYDTPPETTTAQKVKTFEIPFSKITLGLHLELFFKQNHKFSNFSITQWLIYIAGDGLGYDSDLDSCPVQK